MQDIKQAQVYISIKHK